MIILEIKPQTYVGGAMTATGYGATKIKALAISFENAEQASKWMSDYGIDACMIDFETDKPVITNGI
jgi:hypothetical protein